MELKLHAVVSTLFSENAYIAHLPSSSECVVVDPGTDVDDILRAIHDNQLQPRAILNTHGHGDHVAGNGTLKAEFPDCLLIIGEGDAHKLTDPEANLSAGYGFPFISPAADQLVTEGETISAADMEFEVLHTPGHSPGHVVFLYKGQSPWILFGGDVLFQGSIGRTDFPDGSFEDLEKAIHQKLFALPEDTIVLPGHGPLTTIGDEIRMNPFVGIPGGYQWREN